MSVADRQMKTARARARSGASRHQATVDRLRRLDGLIHVGAGLQQDTNYRRLTFPNGEQERREPRREPQPGVGTALEERLDNVGVAFRGRPHEGRLATFAFSCIHYRSAAQQRFDRFGATCSCARHQRGFAARNGGVRIRSGVQQQIHHRAVCVQASEIQRRDSVTVCSPYVCSGTQEGLSCLHVFAVHGPVQSC
jgi:hypothetical protein